MRNKLISMNKLYEDALNFIKQGVSYFLAGIFLIVTVFQMPSNVVDIKVIKGFTWVISAVFIIIGMIVVASIFFNDKWKQWIKKVEMRTTPTLYTIILVQLVINEAKFYQTHEILLLSITGIFITLVLAAIFYMVVKVGVLKSVPSLLLGSLSFMMITMILMMIENSKLSILPYGVIGILLLILAIFRFDKLEKQRKAES